LRALLRHNDRLGAGTPAVPQFNSLQGASFMSIQTVGIIGAGTMGNGIA